MSSVEVVVSLKELGHVANAVDYVSLSDGPGGLGHHGLVAQLDLADELLRPEPAELPLDLGKD